MNKDALLSAAEAARWFASKGHHISRRMISDWRIAGHLPVAERDHNNWPRYRAGDLIKAEKTTRQNPMSSRSLTRRQRCGATTAA